MSDTDDTDLLLLIPPNFFLIQSSDSEDYDLRTADFSRDKNEIERAVVNDLITQVNELENRICAIESSDGSGSLSCNGFCNLSLDSINFKNAKLVNEGSISQFTLMPMNSRFASSLDNVHHNNCLQSDKTVRLRNQFSLPASPISELKQQSLSARTREAIDEDHTDQHFISNKLQNASLHLNEIHSNFGKNGQENYRKNVSNLTSISHGTNNFHANGVENITINKEKEIGHFKDKPLINSNCENFASIKTSLVEMSEESESLSKIMNHDNLDKNDDKAGRNLEVSEVDILLKEMEETQLEIEKKLKSREIHYNMSKPDNYKRTGMYKVGETIESVPDLGFGVRDLFYHKSVPDANSGLGNLSVRTKHGDPVIEEPYIQRKISTLGHYTEHDKNEIKVMKSTTPLSSPLRASPFKHDYRLTPNSSGMKNDDELTISRAKKKINFSPPDVAAHLKSPLKFGVDREHIERSKDDSQMFLSPGLCKSLDDNSSADETRRNDEEGSKKTLSPKRFMKPRMKPRLFKDFDKRYFHNSKSNFKSGGERTLNLDHRGGSRSSNLMSLSDLWHSGGTDSGIHVESDPVKLSQKLEEEKYRRQHCEEQIHELQKRILDDQERLAVALQVDKEKDLAIKKLWNGWQQLSSHWTELEEQRHSLAKELHAQTKAHETQAEDIRKKVDRWEKELSKALDLAAGYKEKCHIIAVEREEFKIEMEDRLKKILEELSLVKDENAKCIEEKNKLEDQLNAAHSESEKDRQLVSEYQKKLTDVEQKLNQLEAEISILREQKENLSLKLKDELSRNKSVTEQKISLQKIIDDYKRQEKNLKDEIRAATERLELSRVELRALYQGQLEAVVKEKLREFQSQLNAAEAALRAELLSREKELAEQAVQQCRTLAESHRLELAGLEEKHKSQLKVLIQKIEEIEEQKIDAQLKLKHETDRRTEIAQKLHSVMETQWRQALNIISSSAASGDAKSQMEWLARGGHDDMKLDLKKLHKSQPNSAGSSNQDTAPFNKSDCMNTYRLASTAASDDPRGNNNPTDAQQNSHLKKYIQMLLDRTPGNPVPGALDQTTSSLGPDEMLLTNSGNITNDSVVSDNPTTDTYISTKEKEKFSSKQSGLEGFSERRQQLQNFNRIFKQPWK